MLEPRIGLMSSCSMDPNGVNRLSHPLCPPLCPPLCACECVVCGVLDCGGAGWPRGVEPGVAVLGGRVQAGPLQRLARVRTLEY